MSQRALLLALVLAVLSLPAVAAPAADPAPAPESAVEARTEATYQAAYFYSVACLAAMGGDIKDQEALLARAQSVDPSSVLLAQERVDALVSLGRKDEAIEVLKRAYASAPADWDLRRKLGALYLDAGRVAEARALYLGPKGKDPQDPDALRALVGMDLQQKDFASAERRLRVLMRHGGGGADDQELLGLTLQHLQRWNEAAGVYRSALALDATRTATWGRLADCDEAAGDTATAAVDLRAGLKANPSSPLLADQLGRLLYRLSDYAGAQAAFNTLVSLDATDAHALLYRGLARLKTGRYKEAEADFRGVGALEHDDPDQGYALALALLMQKKYAAAQKEFKRVIALDPQAEDAWAELAFLQQRRKRPTEAEAELKAGLKALPDSQELALLLAELQQDGKDYAGAEATLRAALARGGGDEVRFQLAVALDQGGDFPSAAKQLGILIDESPKHAEALNYLGYSWAERGEKLPQAEALIRRALALDPGNPYYLDSLGWTLYKQGRAAEALESLTRAAKGLEQSSDADEAEVFDHVQAVQKALGHVEAAAQAGKTAARIRARAAHAKGAAAPDPLKESGL